MSGELGKHILKDVSRSFYLTLRLLPAEMREGASLGYLLARTSDTIADTAAVPVADRISLLVAYADAVSTGGPLPVWPETMREGATAGEVALLARGQEVLNGLARIEERQASLVREVVATIIGGQLGDLRQFGDADEGAPVALADAKALEDYTWSVAGCVGAFWTKLGFLTLGSVYSGENPAVLLERGISYGKGLQLVNILRDLPEDLANGRCYLPVRNASDRDEIMREFGLWHGRAVEQVGQGISYAATLSSRRLRAGTVLPALIAERTLERLDGVSWQDLAGGVKVPRREVYRLLAEALLF